MIGGLKGTINHKEVDFLIVNVSGVGYKVYVPLEVAADASIGDEISLWTYLAVRENALDLYGFADTESQHFFEQLIGISGIGPKGALGILSIAPVPTLKSAIAAGDMSYLTKVSGIGRKNAEKIVLELKDKLVVTESTPELKDDTDTIEALAALGYNRKEARDALSQVDENVEGASNKITAALKILGSK